MEKSLYLSSIIVLFFIHAVATPITKSPQRKNLLLDFVTQHSAEISQHIKRSVKKNTPHKKSQRNAQPSFTAEELAFISVKESAEGGYTPAQDLLAYCYATGTGTKVNARLAFCWYLRAALAGSKSAKDSLIACFEEGVGVTSDPRLSKLLKDLLQ